MRTRLYKIDYILKDIINIDLKRRNISENLNFLDFYNKGI